MIYAPVAVTWMLGTIGVPVTMPIEDTNQGSGPVAEANEKVYGKEPPAAWLEIA